MKKVVLNIWSYIEGIVVFFLKTIFKILHIDLTEKFLEEFIQFIKFGIVGFINTIINYTVNIATLMALASYDISWDYMIANMTAFIVSVFTTCLLNGMFVFRKREGEKRNFYKILVKSYISYSFTGIILNNFLSFIWINYLGISKYVAPIINLIFSVPINFFLNKLWAFKSE